MATERLNMRHVREILETEVAARQLSHRQVAESVGASGRRRRQDDAAGLKAAGVTTWASVERLATSRSSRRASTGRSDGDGAANRCRTGASIHAERLKPGVTLELLHLEYLRDHPDGYRYTAFCEHYRRWLRRRRRNSMRQDHRAGDKAFVDYSGQQAELHRPSDGAARIEVRALRRRCSARRTSRTVPRRAPLAARPALHHPEPHPRARILRRRTVGAGARPAQVGRDDGVSLRAMRSAHLRRDGAALRHDGAAGAAVSPEATRPKVEVAVQIVQRWILARLRNETFFSLAALNEANRGRCSRS